MLGSTTEQSYISLAFQGSKQNHQSHRLINTRPKFQAITRLLHRNIRGVGNLGAVKLNQQTPLSRSRDSVSFCVKQERIKRRLERQIEFLVRTGKSEQPCTNAYIQQRCQKWNGIVTNVCRSRLWHSEIRTYIFRTNRRIADSTVIGKNALR